MSNKITVDPFSSNPMTDAMYNTPYSYNSGFNNLQNVMNMKVLNTIQSNLGYFSTGNTIIDTIIMTSMQCIMIGMITMLVTKISTIPTLILSYLINIYRFIINWFEISVNFIQYKIFNKKSIKMIIRHVDIPYISDTRQLNELYKAVFWYLTHDVKIDYNKEPYLQFVYNHKLLAENQSQVLSDLNIHKILSQNKTKDIKYKDYEITYWLTTENITVHSDKDRIRENFKVQLITKVPENLDKDILEEFCQFCLSEYVKSLTSSKWEQKIFTNSGTEWKSAPSNNSRKIDTVILKNGLKDEIKRDLELFLNSEEWYKDRDIPYTRGYLFYGYPGTGKTSMIKGISTFSKRHIHYLILSNVQSDAQLLDLLKKINYKETILVIEDIDATLEIVKSRDEQQEKEKKEKKEKEEKKDDKKEDKRDDLQKEIPKLTLSGLLNAIDGVFSADGRILIMTTNHPEVLDEALIRPGRIDCKYLFDNCDSNQIKDLFKIFFNKNPDENLLKEIKSEKYSPAHITSVFLKYRENPQKSLLHLDDESTKIFLPKRELYDKKEAEKKEISTKAVRRDCINKNFLGNDDTQPLYPLGQPMFEFGPMIGQPMIGQPMMDSLCVPHIMNQEIVPTNGEVNLSLPVAKANNPNKEDEIDEDMSYGTVITQS